MPTNNNSPTHAIRMYTILRERGGKTGGKRGNKREKEGIRERKRREKREKKKKEDTKRKREKRMERKIPREEYLITRKKTEQRNLMSGQLESTS